MSENIDCWKLLRRVSNYYGTNDWNVPAKKEPQISWKKISWKKKFPEKRKPDFHLVRPAPWLILSLLVTLLERQL